MATLSKTILTVKTDKRLKAEAQKVAEQLGFPLGTVVNALLKQFVRDQALNVSMAYTPSSYLQRILDEIEQDLAAGKNISTGFDSVEDAIGYLESSK